MKLEQLIEKIDALKTELDELRPIQEDRLNRLNQKMRLDWNFHSNSIESKPIRFKQNKLYGFFPQNRKGEYEFLEDFIICFARFQKPNGNKGWLYIFGNEFLD